MSLSSDDTHFLGWCYRSSKYQDVMWSVFLHLSPVSKKGSIQLVNLSAFLWVLFHTVCHRTALHFCQSEEWTEIFSAVHQMWNKDADQPRWSRQSISCQPLLIMGICFPFLDNVCKYVFRNQSLLSSVPRLTSLWCLVRTRGFILGPPDSPTLQLFLATKPPPSCDACHCQHWQNCDNDKILSLLPKQKIECWKGQTSLYCLTFLFFFKTCQYFKIQWFLRVLGQQGVTFKNTL